MTDAMINSLTVLGGLSLGFFLPPIAARFMPKNPHLAVAEAQIRFLTEEVAALARRLDTLEHRIIESSHEPRRQQSSASDL